MNIRIKNLKGNYEFTRIIFLSMFLTMFFEIIDAICNTHLSIIGNCVFFLGIFYVKIKSKTLNVKIGLFWSIIFIESCFLFINQVSMISTLYPILLNFIIFIYIYKYFDSDFFYVNIEKIRYLLFVYLIINVILYLSKNQIFIQYDGFYRFKGALPHSNMLSGVLFGFIFLNSIKQDKFKLVLDLLIIILIFIAGSRIYIVVTIICYIILNYHRNSRIGSKKNLLYSFLLIITFVMILLYNKNSIYTYISNTNTYKRYFYLQNSSDGRDDLSYYFNYVFNNSNLSSKIFGGNMSSYYYSLTQNIFSHSFSENSIMSITVSFGMFGLGIYIMMYILYIIKILKSKINTKWIKIILILITLFTTYYQDVILSTQLFMIYSVILSVLAIENNKK